MVLTNLARLSLQEMVNINKSSNIMLQHHHYDNDLWKILMMDTTDQKYKNQH